jgi:hypothetical protein
MTVKMTWGFGSNPGTLKWADHIHIKFFLRKPLNMVLGVLVCLGIMGTAQAGSFDPSLDFTVHTLASGRPGKTALIVGGIQGDEPGGFNAAALIATHYKILSGQVIVVPNLNFPSIVRRSRGVHGDMNRKFDYLKSSDPEWKTIGRIKSMIQDPEVDFILNLHDGSGFYTLDYESPLRHPGRWGQSIIVDQAVMPKSSDREARLFADLVQAADQSALAINNRLLDPTHKVHVKNTRTAQGNEEMAKTLTFFCPETEQAGIWH